MTEVLSNLKYIIFFLILFGGVPTFYLLSKKYPKFENMIFFLLIFFTARMEDINFVSREFYRGTSKGFEIGMVDIMLLTLMLLLINRKGLSIFSFRRTPKGFTLFLLYFILSLFSIINSASYLFSSFEVWKMLRMMFFFVIFYNYLDSDEKVKILINSFIIIIIYVGLTVLKQKYVDHKFQTAGPFPHQITSDLLRSLKTGKPDFFLNRKIIYI